MAETIGSIMGIGISRGRNTRRTNLEKEVKLCFNLPPLNILAGMYIVPYSTPREGGNFFKSFGKIFKLYRWEKKKKEEKGEKGMKKQKEKRKKEEKGIKGDKKGRKGSNKEKKEGKFGKFFKMYGGKFFKMNGTIYIPEKFQIP